MLTLAPCPHCAARVPEDGTFCDSCGRQLAACPTCGELAKPGEKCLKDGVAVELRKSAAGGPAPPGPLPGQPFIKPPPKPGTKTPVQPTSPGPVNVSQPTTVQVLARKLRLVATSGEPLAPLELDPDTIVGRGEGPFAMQLDPFFNKNLSRRHCQFRRGPTGNWTITDLAGRGSTWVSADGRFADPPIAQNASQPVEPGRDQVRLGQLSFRVEAIP
jgi:hypothetical protein